MMVRMRGAAWRDWPARQGGAARSGSGPAAAALAIPAHLFGAKVVCSVDGLAEDHGRSHVLQVGDTWRWLSPAVSQFCWHAASRGIQCRTARCSEGARVPGSRKDPGWAGSGWDLGRAREPGPPSPHLELIRRLHRECAGGMLVSPHAWVLLLLRWHSPGGPQLQEARCQRGDTGQARSLGQGCTQERGRRRLGCRRQRQRCRGWSRPGLLGGSPLFLRTLAGHI